MTEPLKGSASDERLRARVLDDDEIDRLLAEKHEADDEDDEDDEEEDDDAS